MRTRRKKPLRSDPIYTSVPKRETRMDQRAAHTNAQSTNTETSSTLRSGRFQLRSFWQCAFFHIAPQGDQEFACQRHNPNPSYPTAAFGKAFAIPAAQLAVGLVAQPRPGDLDRQRPHRTVAG